MRASDENMEARVLNVASYQSHDGETSVSDSMRKLERLNLPDLAGKRVLDIGCNEGFFCNAAAERGAGYVLGIDSDRNAIEIATRRYQRSNVEFRVQNWRVLPEGPFDVVLWISGMHYERDPVQVVGQVCAILSLDGVLILECGVITDRWHKAMVPISRQYDTPLYPTIRFLLEEILQGSSARWVAGPELTRWDPVPRSVFHCRPHSTVVVLIRGRSKLGKSTLARLLGPAANKTIGVDEFVGSISAEKYFSAPIQMFIRDRCTIHDLETFIGEIDDAGLTHDYVSLFVRTIAPTDRMVVVEGFMTDMQVAELVAQLQSKAAVWDLRRIDVQRAIGSDAGDG